jgi:hypothetical protein
MGLFGFWRRGRADAAIEQWHADWEAALSRLDDAAAGQLEARLRALAATAEDVEVEDEMLQALRDAVALERDLAGGLLPAVDTTHRVAAGERCHFSAPVSMPDDPAQATGRLLLTAGRAAFAGGSRSPSMPWHATRDVIRHGRDLLFVRAGGDEGSRFRCNSFSDAVRGAAIARHLIRAARRQPL